LNTAADALSRMVCPVETATDTEQDVDTDTNWTEYVPTETAAVTRNDDTHMVVPAEMSHATRVDRINIEFGDDDDRAVGVAPIGAITQLPMLDDVRNALRHCPDFAPLLDYL